MWNRSKDTPCYQCENRCVGCHSSCVDYTRYKEKCDTVHKKMQSERSTENAIKGILINGNKSKGRRKYNVGIKGS